MSTSKMTPDEFERIYKAYREALKPYDGSDLVETRKFTLGHPIDVPIKPDMGEAMGGQGKHSFGIPTGEWSLIKAIQEGKVNGRIQTEGRDRDGSAGTEHSGSAEVWHMLRCVRSADV